MTSSRSSSRKSATCRWAFRGAIAASCALLCALAFFPSSADAQDAMRQYSRQAMIGGKLPASIILVGWEKDSADIEKLLDIVTAKASETYARLDGSNPASDVAKLAAGGKISTTPEVAAAFDAVKKVCDWAGGAFDVVVSGSGSCRDIKAGKSDVEFKGSGASFNLSPIINGFMAEMMARLIFAAGMQNAIVKVGSVFRGFGQGMNGPWKIQVEDDAGTFAHHALNLTVINTGIAAVSASQFRAAQPFDPRSKSQVAPPVRGVVSLMSDAALADGIANAVFILGPDEGMKLLSKVARGLIVDNAGKFARTPGF